MTAAMTASGHPNAVLVVDQFEELFAFDDGTGIRAKDFCARLADYATGTAPVIIVVRADHLAHLTIDLTLAKLAERGMHLVRPLAGDELRQAIEAPAALSGLRLESGLVDLLVRDTEGEPGALPLLSHALAETWQRRDGRVLTVEGYRATGEIRGAVARTADRLYESLPVDQREKLRWVLMRLVSPTADGEPVRSRVATRTLVGDADRERLLGLLVGARLVIAERDSVELAHEAIARAWPRLRSWLDEDAAGQRIRRHLSAAADGWESLGRPDSELYRGARLELATEWRDAGPRDLTTDEEAFLDASVAAAESARRAADDQARAQARQRRQIRRGLVAASLIVIASVVGGFALYRQVLGGARSKPSGGDRGRGEHGGAAAARASRRRRAARRGSPSPVAQRGDGVGAVRVGDVHRRAAECRLQRSLARCRVGNGDDARRRFRPRERQHVAWSTGSTRPRERTDRSIRSPIGVAAPRSRCPPTGATPSACGTPRRCPTTTS